MTDQEKTRCSDKIENMTFNELLKYSKEAIVKGIQFNKSLDVIIIELLFNGIIWAEARYKHNN